MVEIGGNCEEGFGAIADAFRNNFEEHKEVGAACSVVKDGNLVVDLWGGHLDKQRKRPWLRDSLVTVWSGTKGMAATATAIAHSRGLFELDEPVCTYWPEFAANGKENITVDQLLRHQAGLAVIDTPLDLEILGDFDRLGTILAEQKPGWEPGTKHGYHAVSLGWYQSQLMSRIDPAGRTIGQFFADEVAAVLDVEFYIGLPQEVSSDRVARIVGGTKLGQALNIRQVPWPVLKGLLDPRTATFKTFTNPKALTKMPDMNKRELLDLDLPSANGTGTARAVASVYGDLATGGKRLGINASTLEHIEQPGSPALDEIFGIESAFRFGFMKEFPLFPFGSSPRAYGHTGSGGSFSYADPDHGVGYCYAMNRAGYHVPEDPREVALRTALQTCLD